MPGFKQFAGRDACSKLGNLINDAGSVLHSFDHFRLAFHVESRTPSPVRLLGGNQATKVAPVQALRIKRLVLFFCLAQFLFPWCSTVYTAYGKLSTQIGRRICYPGDLANGLVPAALQRQQISQTRSPGTDQARSFGIDVVGARRVGRDAIGLAKQAPAQRQGQVRRLFSGICFCTHYRLLVLICCLVEVTVAVHVHSDNWPFVTKARLLTGVTKA